MSITEFSGIYLRGDILYSAFDKLVDKVNCSFVQVPYTSSNDPDEYGNYSGAIGMVQRQQVDVLFAVIRPDNLPFEPGIPGPVIMSADATVLSRKNYSKPIEREIASFIYDFDEVSYAYFFIVMTLYCC